MPYNPGDQTRAKWQDGIGHDHIIEVTIIDLEVPAAGSDPNFYRVQTNMGVTMLLAESDLGQ